MPSPLAHLATGLAIHLATQPPKRRWRQLGVLSAATVLPDFDFALGLCSDRVGAFHNRESHSGLFVVSGAALMASLAGLDGGGQRRAILAGLSHLLLDGLGSRRGLMLLWPLSRRRFRGNVRLFRGLRWQTTWGSPEHKRTLRNELPYALAIIIIGYCLGRTGRLLRKTDHA